MKKKNIGYLCAGVGVLCFIMSMGGIKASIFVAGTGLILLITSAILLSRPLPQGTYLKGLGIALLGIFGSGIILWPTLLYLTNIWSQPDALYVGLTMLFLTLPLGFLLWIPFSLITVKLLRKLWKIEG